jgi:hypothetical protein
VWVLVWVLGRGLCVWGVGVGGGGGGETNPAQLGDEASAGGGVRARRDGGGWR